MFALLLIAVILLFAGDAAAVLIYLQLKQFKAVSSRDFGGSEEKVEVPEKKDRAVSEEDTKRQEKIAAEMERLWQESISNILSYDMSIARKAGRDAGDE